MFTLQHVTPTQIALLILMSTTLVLIVSGAMQFVKQAIEVFLDPVTQKKKHDIAVQAAAIVVGIVAIELGSLLFISPWSVQLGAVALILGYAVGLASMGQYSLLTSLIKLLEGQPVVTPPAPPTSVTRTQSSASSDPPPAPPTA